MSCMVLTLGLPVLLGDVLIGDGVIGTGMDPALALGVLMLSLPRYRFHILFLLLSP